MWEQKKEEKEELIPRRQKVDENWSFSLLLDQGILLLVNGWAQVKKSKRPSLRNGRPPPSSTFASLVELQKLNERHEGNDIAGYLETTSVFGDGIGAAAAASAIAVHTMGKY